MTFPESAADRARYILDFVDAHGDAIDWTTIVVPHNGRIVTFDVMTDALKIEGVRVVAGAGLAQQIADRLGASLPTPRMVDHVWDAATVKVDPKPRQISRSTRAVIDHSADVDAAVAGRTGLVDNAGKWWVLVSKLATSAGKACNFGWRVPKVDAQNHWRSIPTEADVDGKHRVIQGPGTAHGLEQDDYSQTVRLVRNLTVDGVARPLAEGLRDPEICGALSHEGPVAVSRQPGVPLPPLTPADSSADTHPQLPAVAAEVSLGFRCVLWSRQQMRLANPPSDTLRAAWLAPCERSGKRLGLSKGNHCAATCCAAATAVLAAGEAMPHGYRAGAKELMADAQARHAWHPASEVRAGTWAPAVGDVVIWDRSQPGKPETSWMGHASRVTEVGSDDHPGHFRTIGANEGAGGGWVESWRPIDHARLLGFIAYPQLEPVARDDDAHRSEQPTLPEPLPDMHQPPGDDGEADSDDVLAELDAQSRSDRDEHIGGMP